MIASQNWTVIMTVALVAWFVNGKDFDDEKVKITQVGSIPKNFKVSKVQLEYEIRPLNVYKSCHDVPTTSGSGIYTIDLNGEHKQVYCEINLDGTKYLVIQRRIDGSTNFYRNWAEYERGFGNLEHEFWIGNKALHMITSQAKYKLRVDLLSFDNVRKFAEYESFAIGSSETKYRLTLSGYVGNAGDSLAYHNGDKFTTYDQDNDQLSSVNCASRHKGAWWYYSCHHSNLNGLYYIGRHDSTADGINWNAFKGLHESMKTTAMKIYY